MPVVYSDSIFEAQENCFEKAIVYILGIHCIYVLCIHCIYIVYTLYIYNTIASLKKPLCDKYF